MSHRMAQLINIEAQGKRTSVKDGNIEAIGAGNLAN